jgi:hypothetical protein
MFNDDRLEIFIFKRKIKVIELRLEIIYFLSPLFRSLKVTTGITSMGASPYVARDIGNEYRNGEGGESQRL